MVGFKRGEASITIDPQNGARMTSLTIGDLQLLTPRQESIFHWGSFPMIPWVGRIRNGVFSHKGKQHQLPLNMPPHSIHGTTYDRAWQQTDPAGDFEISLGENWPFAGRAVQRFRLNPNSLEQTLEIHSDGESFPASCGWHPWFERQLARGEEAELKFQAESMYHRDEEYIADGPLIQPGPSPWDDCFKGVKQPVEIIWPGALKLILESDTDHWVVYNMPEHAFCVEPQTGPPDALNLAPNLVTPNKPLIARTWWRWELL